MVVGKLSAGGVGTIAAGVMEIRGDDGTTTSNNNIFSDFELVIHNDNATENAFAGIAFKSNTVNPSEDTDRIGAAIRAVRHTDNMNTSYDKTDLRFAVNNLYDKDLFDRLTIKYDGNVGVGTTNPGELFDVSGGKIRCNYGAITSKYTSDSDHYGYFEVRDSSDTRGCYIG
jgi:hypothetical protein